MTVVAFLGSLLLSGDEEQRGFAVGCGDADVNDDELLLFESILENSISMSSSSRFGFGGNTGLTGCETGIDSRPEFQP